MMNDSGDYLLCDTCEAVSPKKFNYCPRCRSTLHHRTHNSLEMSWVWIVSSIVFFFPAMYFPISIVDNLGVSDPSTIWQSVVHFWADGSWFVAVIILVASIVIPSFKILFLMIILLNIRFKKNSYQQCMFYTNIYRFLKLIGRWSMIDVFVVALLSILVQFGGVANVVPDIGIIFFLLVVLTTIFAVDTFDPRMIWDSQRE